MEPAAYIGKGHFRFDSVGLKGPVLANRAEWATWAGQAEWGRSGQISRSGQMGWSILSCTNEIIS